MNYNEIHKEVSIRDIFAYCFRVCLFIALGALIGAALFLGYRIYDSHTENGIREYRAEVDEYEINLSNLKRNLSSLELSASLMADEISNNPLFDIYEKDLFSTVVSFSVDADGDMYKMADGTIVSVFQTKMLSFWNTIQFKEFYPHDINEEYIMQFLQLTGDHPFYSIAVYGFDNDETQTIARELYNRVEEYVNSVAGVQITNSKTVTDVYKGDKFLLMAAEKKENYSETLSEISQAQMEIQQMEKKTPSHHYGRFLVLGFIVGFLFTALLSVFILWSRNPVTSSFDAEGRLGVMFIGALFVDCSFFDKLARRVLGERFYSKNDAHSYIINQFQSESGNPMKGNEIALICSCNSKKAAKAADEIKNLLNPLGFNVSYISDATSNPDAINSINSCDYIVLLEKQWESRWVKVASSVTRIERLGKKIAGFILC